MRRINLNGIAAFCRAAEGLTTVSAASIRSTSYELIPISLYSTRTDTNSSWRSSWFAGNYSKVTQSSGCAVTGAVIFSAAVSSLAGEVHAKETLPPSLRPEEVVLYQYEACPFCNKVKGNFFFHCCLFYALVLFHFMSCRVY